MAIPRHRRDVVPVAASARWRGGSRRSTHNLTHWSISTQPVARHWVSALVLDQCIGGVVAGHVVLVDELLTGCYGQEEEVSPHGCSTASRAVYARWLYRWAAWLAALLAVRGPGVVATPQHRAHSSPAARRRRSFGRCVQKAGRCAAFWPCEPVLGLFNTRETRGREGSRRAVGDASPQAPPS